MAASQLPSSTDFVVNVPEGDVEAALADSRTEAQRREVLDEASFVVELPVQTDPRDAWKRLIEQFSPAAWVSPVVVDEGDTPHYPTGDVTVRFTKPLSDGELQRFAEANDLELRSRNEFVAEQASFRPRDLRATYLPDLVARLEDDGDVGMAWLNTKTRYKRV
jgi:hypothetical protein